jgi:ribosomal protein L11 methyltransferase
MFVWRKLVDPRWIKKNEQTLCQFAGNDLAIVDRPGHKRSRLEVACKSRRRARELVDNFGGRFEKLPRDWLKRFENKRRSVPLNIGTRLIILNVGGTSVSRRTGRKGSSCLVIPAGGAFGTGEHVTTAMCLRMLEKITRLCSPESPWSLLDLGTGSGVLALAAKCFGAGRVVAIDIDPTAISTARANARLNKIRNIDFQVTDVRKRRPKGEFDIILANLFSELLVKILPRLKANLARGGQVILSGVLRTQERELDRALQINKIDMIQVRRRGKWIAILAKNAAASGKVG